MENLRKNVHLNSCLKRQQLGTSLQWLKWQEHWPWGVSIKYCLAVSIYCDFWDHIEKTRRKASDDLIYNKRHFIWHSSTQTDTHWLKNWDSPNTSWRKPQVVWNPFNGRNQCQYQGTWHGVVHVRGTTGDSTEQDFEYLETKLSPPYVLKTHNPMWWLRH